MPEPKGSTYLDIETTGLGPHAQAFEVAWMPVEDDSYASNKEPQELILEHTLFGAEPMALEINRYWERDIPQYEFADEFDLNVLRMDLANQNLIIANPPFDTRFLDQLLGYEPWHHRCTDIESYAQAVFDLRYPPGMSTIYKMLVDLGHEIPEPDHSAGGDVLAMAACHRVLKAIAFGQREVARRQAEK